MTVSQRWLLFWGSVLLLLGFLFALRALGVIEDVLSYFWAGFLLLAGIGLILSARFAPRAVEEEIGAVVGLQGGRRASVEFDHGAGRMEITGGAPPDVLLTANRGTGMKVSSRMEGDVLKVQVDCGPSFAPFIGPPSGAWRFRLNEEIPLTLNVESGASQLVLDLRDLQVIYLKLEGGANSVVLTPPARVENVLIDAEASVSSLVVHIPQGVAARIRLKEGPASVNVDQERFPCLGERVYQSEDYDRSAYRVELNIEASISTVTVR